MTERGTLEIQQFEELPQTLPRSDGAGIPPVKLTGRMFEDNDKNAEASLFWSLGQIDPNDADVLGLGSVLERYDLLTDGPQETGVKKRGTLKENLWRLVPGNRQKDPISVFIDEAHKRGLVNRQKSLSVWEYIGALLPSK
jgi:hypothetical protein